MPRKPRIHYSGAYYHVMLRGNNRQTIFSSDDDRRYFLCLMQKGVESYHHHVHAFCLMDNHVHLAIEVGDVILSKIIHNLSFRYSQWIHKRKKSVGHVFQGRFQAILVESDSYFLELIRYIHLNPVRAGITLSPEDYRWCSHRTYLGLESTFWLTTSWMLSFFSEQISTARTRYLSFIIEGIQEGYRNEFHCSSSIASTTEKISEEKLLSVKNTIVTKVTLNDIIFTVCNMYTLSLKDITKKGKHRSFAKARAIIAYLVSEIDFLSLKELSTLLNRDPTSLSEQVTNIKKSYQTNKEIQYQIDELKRELQKKIDDKKNQILESHA